MIKDDHYLTTSCDIRGITASFFKKTQISYFEQIRFFKDGNVVIFTTKPDLISYIILKNYNIIEPTPKDLWDQKNFFYLLPLSHTIKDLSKKYHTHHPLEYILICDDYVDTFSFVFDIAIPDYQCLNTYFNKKQTLENFVFEFIDKTANLMKKSKANKLYLSENVKKIQIYDEQRIVPYTFPQKKTSNDIDFTKRQKECLKLLLTGRSSKSIGRKLNISSRTVEYHLEIIKEKTKCRFKSELIDFIFSNQHFKNSILGTTLDE